MNIQRSSLLAPTAPSSTIGASMRATARMTHEAAPDAASDVTISAAAQARLAREGAASHSSPTARDQILAYAHADPVLAKQLAEDEAYGKSYETSGAFVDITQNPIRFSFTGEVVTDSGQAAFKREAQEARLGRQAIYEAERAKGTPDADILDKMYAYNETRSDDFLAKLGWWLPASTQTS